MDLLARCRRHFVRRGEWWWVPMFYALVVIWIYRDLWHQHSVATGLGWDTIDSYGPDLDFFAGEIADGRFSLWNPYDKGGYPLFCDPQIDRYYPFNWPFAAWGALLGTSWWLVQIKVLAHHVVAAGCMHLFLRSRGLSVRAALIGGVAIVACAPLLVHKASIILWPLVWVPLIWTAIDWLIAAPSWRRGVGAAAAFSLSATAASPPGLFYAMLLVGPYAIWRLVGALRERHDRQRLVRLAIAVAAAGLVAGLVLAVTVLPAQELVALGSRDRFAPPGRSFALALSLPLPAAARGLFVRGAGLFEMYMGIAVVMLAVCAVAVRPRFDRGAAWLWLAIASCGVVLAAGATTPVLPWLVDHVPGFAMLRVPGRYKLVAAWPIAACAGYGVAALEAARADRRMRKRVLALAGAITVVAIAMVAGWGHPPSPTQRAAWWSVVAAALAGGAIVATVWTPRRVANVALAALTLGVLFDAPLFTFVPPRAPPAAEPRQLHARDAEIVARLDGVRDRWRVYDEYVLGERAGARLRIRDFRGYPALDPISLHRYVDVLDFAKRDAAIITDFNVRWVLARPHFRYGNAISFVAMPHPAFETRGGELWEAKHPAPLVQWVGAVTIVPQRAALAAMRAAEDGDGVRRRAVLEPGDAMLVPFRLTGAIPDAREGVIDSYQPDAIAISIDAPREGLVVLDEIMFPGWRVEVDGQPATALRANYLLRAVWVDGGHHTIVWRFEPRRWRILVAGYLVALAIMLAAAIRRSTAKTPKTPRPEL